MRKIDTEEKQLLPEEATEQYSRNCGNKKRRDSGTQSTLCGHREWQECDGGGDYKVQKGVPEIQGYHVRGAGITVISPRGYRIWEDEPGPMVAERKRRNVWQFWGCGGQGSMAMNGEVRQGGHSQKENKNNLGEVTVWENLFPIT